MKILDQRADLLVQQLGVIGMKKHIELCGRICYKSENKITEDSYDRFVKMLYNKGHWNALSLGTVYLKVSADKIDKFIKLINETKPYTKYNLIDGIYYITTNYRIICQLELEDEMNEFWSDPDNNFYHRATAKFICSRSTANQIIRHRIFCFLQESQRYVNYNKSGDVTYIFPEWAKNVYRELINMENTVTHQTNSDLAAIVNPEERWEILKTRYDLVLNRDKFWKLCEEEYKTCINYGLKPEDARGVLCNDTKTELCMCGYISDWFDEPKEDVKEKFGYFSLRMAPDAQLDVRTLSTELKSKFIESGLDKLK